MKILLVPRFILMSTSFLCTLDLNAQNQTAAEKQDLCKNNKARIAELESQLTTVKEEVGKIWVNEEIENARTDMLLVRKIKNVKSEGDWSKNRSSIMTMAKTKDYQFDFADCLHNSPGTLADVKACLSSFELSIGKRIDKAVTDQKKYPDLTKQKQNIESLIATHKKNLSLLGCKEPDMVLYNNTAWEGPWVATVEGELMKMNLNGTGVFMTGIAQSKMEELTTIFEVKGCLEMGPDKMLCDFDVTYDDEEMTMKAKGRVEMQLKGDNITSSWKELAPPSVKWKPGHEKNIVQIRGANTYPMTFKRE
jgi:hypothetical protein